MLDQIRRDIQGRLDQLLTDADKLRRALAALGSRNGQSATADPVPASGPRAPRRAGANMGTSAVRAERATARPAAKSRDAAKARPAKSVAAGTSSSAPRTAPGATRAAVLAALANGGAMTAGDVAAATGLGRPTVSTTLSRLAKTGDVSKVARGYQLSSPTSNGTGSPTGASTRARRSA